MSGEAGPIFGGLTDQQLQEEIDEAVQFRDWDYYALLTAEEERRGL